MRVRATVVAVSGALALSALAVPAAQAAGSGSHHPVDTFRARHEAASGGSALAGARSAAGAPYRLDARFGSVRINRGRAIVAGTGGKVTVPVTFRITHGAGVDLTAEDVELDLVLYRGASFAHPDHVLIGDFRPTCDTASATVASCTGTIDVSPSDELGDVDATVWKAAGYVTDWNDVDPGSDDVDWTKVGYAEGDGLATVRLQRSARLTVDAAPEPVRKGRTLTVTGALTRADWDADRYARYSGQAVRLQFRKKGSSTYSTVKTVRSSATGGLKTTVKASVDGYYRFVFAGSSTTAAVSAAGDFVDVR
ncbi:hypothetical protein KMT30_40190 [Streptomyces sp. IBSBF 2953]|uniref:hypothetical protein n=1 Tax=Streptomyces TaxID=1883 RepID=UPI00211A9814|nr:hypothetical protein [Streptomyces scabiei]MCQ9185146.1 hypothetical protein [Streptomyces hayashii]MDX3117231.1 hypothetical protein [Streptomyces scabiei]